MADVTISREAVERAARAYITQLISKHVWTVEYDQLTDLEKHNARETAMAMLNASAPHIVADELERAAKDFELEADEITNDMTATREPVVEAYRAEINQFRARAAELRAQS